VASTAQRSKARKVRLNAGEQTTATSSGVGTPIVVPDLPAVLSWPTGRLSFRGRLLREAVNDVNRYTTKPIVLAPDVGDIVVTGTLMINNVGSWVKSLERAFDLKATEEKDRIVLAASTANR
jgi:transmembrane sensor